MSYCIRVPRALPLSPSGVSHNALGYHRVPRVLSPPLSEISHHALGRHSVPKAVPLSSSGISHNAMGFLTMPPLGYHRGSGAILANPTLPLGYLWDHRCPGAQEGA